MFQSVTELDISTRSPVAWAVFMVEIWGAFCYSGITASGLYIASLMMFVCETWLDLFIPVANKPPIYKHGIQYFQTQSRGIVSELDMI